jgi:hypothetical protein
MAEARLIVLSNPIEGREDEYNHWYTGTHLEDVLAVEGFHAAQRFRFSPGRMSKDAPHRYLAIYEIEDGKRKQAEDAVIAASRTDAMSISGALEWPATAWWFEAISERVEEQ